MKRYFALAGLALGLTFVVASSAWAAPCDSLAGLNVTGGKVISAEHVDKGKGPPTERMTVANFSPMPGYCRVKASVSSGPGSKIQIEVWLPDSEDWNGKFFGTGNGAFGGTMPIDWLSSGVRLHYATANTDMGTADAGGYDGGIGKPEYIKDWGWRSTHAMTVVGKEVTQAFYHKSIVTSIFAGCSTGGHQGLMEAQRFPDDYKGIVAGDPGNYRIGLHLAFLYYPRVAHDNPGFWISRDQATMVRQRVLARCAGQNSGLKSDDFVANPSTCDFDPQSLLCRAGDDSHTCLTASQLAMLKKIYAGVQNLANGHTIYPGEPFGTEVSMMSRLGAQEGAPLPGNSSLINWAKGTAFDPATFDFNKDVEELYTMWGADINAVSADLSQFRRQGGKLILFHGWEDTTVSPYDSINYYDRLSSSESFARLFMVPGMGHCLNGPGFTNFGARSVEGEVDDADHNIILALDRWVSTGKAPEKVIATKWSGGGGRGAAGAPAGRGAAAAPDGRGGAGAPANNTPARGGNGGQDNVAVVPAAPIPRTVEGTRPLCAYPNVAQYKGAGDVTKAENFQCVAAARAKYIPPAPEYLVNAGTFGR